MARSEGGGPAACTRQQCMREGRPATCSSFYHVCSTVCCSWYETCSHRTTKDIWLSSEAHTTTKRALRNVSPLGPCQNGACNYGQTSLRCIPHQDRSCDFINLCGVASLRLQEAGVASKVLVIRSDCAPKLAASASYLPCHGFTLGA